MTSLAFVMGVLPLVLSTGAGAEMRQAMGVAVFAGMIGVTAFGLFLTPVFYVLLRALSGNRPLTQHGRGTEAGCAGSAPRDFTRKRSSFLREVRGHPGQERRVRGPIRQGRTATPLRRKPRRTWRAAI